MICRSNAAAYRRGQGRGPSGFQQVNSAVAFVGECWAKPDFRRPNNGSDAPARPRPPAEIADEHLHPLLVAHTLPGRHLAEERRALEREPVGVAPGMISTGDPRLVAASEVDDGGLFPVD